MDWSIVLSAVALARNVVRHILRAISGKSLSVNIMKREDIPNWDKLSNLERAQIIACYPELALNEVEGIDFKNKKEEE